MSVVFFVAVFESRTSTLAQNLAVLIATVIIIIIIIVIIITSGADLAFRVCGYCCVWRLIQGSELLVKWYDNSLKQPDTYIP